MPILLLFAVAFGLLITGFWCYVLVLNQPQFTAGKAAWLWTDALVRIVLWLALGLGAVLAIGYRRGATPLLIAWSAVWLVWLPISAVGAVSTGEPPPDVAMALVLVAMFTRMAFPPVLAIATAALCLWLLLPLLVLLWLGLAHRWREPQGTSIVPLP